MPHSASNETGHLITATRRLRRANILFDTFDLIRKRGRSILRLAGDGNYQDFLVDDSAGMMNNVGIPLCAMAGLICYREETTM